MNGRSLGRVVGVLVVVASLATGVVVSGEGEALRLRASVIGASATRSDVLTIDLRRWSTEAERAPVWSALSAPPPAPAVPAAPAVPTAGRAGRGGRGGREAAPPSPLARLTAAVRAAPTVGYIWGEGPTGYSIKYAWHSVSVEGGERIVLITDRRLGAHQPLWPVPLGAAPNDSEFTVIELRLDGKGHGEAKTSVATGVVLDSAAGTLALDGYASAPSQLKVTR